MSAVEGSHDEAASVSNRASEEEDLLPQFARAKYPFDGRNNDELSFKAGDIVAVTQRLDGGWWEGTFASNTGWFPSGYVTLLNDSERNMHLNGNLSDPEAQAGGTLKELSAVNGSSRQAYHQQILEGFLVSEREYITVITDFYHNFLLKFQTQITKGDYLVLSGNMDQLVTFQKEMFDDIESAVTKDVNNAKVGGILLLTAPTLRMTLRTYCENHPLAIDLVLKNRQSYTDIAKGLGRELKDLIYGLSLPFRHLDKYAATLNELERSMQGTHPDRGNTQRASFVFRDIANFCTSVRKQKEMQLELKTSGLIEGLSSKELEELGDIVYMGSVTLGDEDALVEDQLPVDRCLVLFPSTLLVLEITQKLNAYLLKQKISTTGLIVRRIEPKLTLSLTSGDGLFNNLMTVAFTEELQRWIESFSTCPNVEIDENCCVITPAPPQKIEVSKIRNLSELSPLRRAEVSQMPAALKAEKGKKLSGFRFDHDLEMILPENDQEKEDCKDQIKAPLRTTKLYSGYCLRPYPVVRGNWAVDYSKKVNVRLRKSASQADQEDAFLLRIIEGYCDLGKKSKMVNCGLSLYQGHTPQLIVAENEKIFMEEVVGDEVVVQEKSLVDTVYSLKDQLISLQKVVRQLVASLDKEQKKRRRLEELVRQYSS